MKFFSKKDSNLFLRCLWATLRKDFGKCAWQFQPHKYGKLKKISFGYVNLTDDGDIFNVSIEYDKKDIIKTLIFKGMSQDAENLYDKIRISIEEAEKNYISQNNHSFAFVVESMVAPLGSYEGKAFKILNLSDNKSQIIFNVEGFDRMDASKLALSKINRLMDVLCVETNSSFWLSEDNSSPTSVDNIEIFSDQLDSDQEDIVYPAENEDGTDLIIPCKKWIDDYPIVGEKLRISLKCKKFIDNLILDSISEKDEVLLSSFHHFHTGRKIEGILADRLRFAEAVHTNETVSIEISEDNIALNTMAKYNLPVSEVATVMYISALEVASSIEGVSAKKCECCGQPIYSISKRVRTYVQQNLGTNVSDGYIKPLYNTRSKYLHAGITISENNYTGSTIPQLDSDMDHGVSYQISPSPINLREYTSYCLRIGIPE